MAQEREQVGCAEQLNRLKEENERLKRELDDLRTRQSSPLRAVFDAAPFAVFVEKLDGTIIDCNETACTISGYSRHELLTMGATDLVPPEVAESFPDLIEQEMTTGGFFVEAENVRKGGIRFPAEVASSLIKLEGKDRLLVVVHDITRRKLSEDALQAEKKRLEVTLSSIGDGVIATDTSGRVTLMNPVAEKLCGWDRKDALGRSLNDVFRIVNEHTHREVETPVGKVLESGNIVGLANHTLLISRNGAELPIADSGAPIRSSEGETLGVILVFRDQTHERRMELELQRAQRMQSVGTMAGGLAHDFNNVLTAVMGNLSLARRPGLDAHLLNRYLTKAENACVRARELTENLLNFARGGSSLDRSKVEVASLVDRAAELAIPGSSVMFRNEVDRNLPMISVDRVQITQVFQNLLLNSVQAMPGGGNITVSADVSSVPDGNELSLLPADYFCVTVEDNGPGIPGEIVSQIFDPYFSTKPYGTGLGLASCYSIVKGHDGSIHVTTEPGKGSRFHVYLPFRLEELRRILAPK